MLPIITSRLLRWQDGQSAGPWRLKIFPTYRCNLECGICVRNWHETNPVLFDELPDARWLRLIDEAAAMGVRALIIGGGGEPMLRSKLVREICVKAKAHGMHGSLQTNATHLSAESIETFIKTGWDFVTISVDAPNEDANDAIRNKGVFARTETALQSLRELKEKHNSALPNVAIHMTITALNYDCLEDMVHFCRARGVNMLSASPLLEVGMETTRYVLTQEQRNALPALIQKAINRADELGLQHTLNSLLMIEEAPQAPQDAASNNAWPQGHLAHALCLEPWTALTIVSSGHISPCCFFWENHADSIRDKSLAEVWAGSYLSRFRQQMRNAQPHPYCLNCYYPESQEHRELMQCLRETATVRTTLFPGWRAFPAKAWNSLHRHGVHGSLQRFKQWRSIRRALKGEK